MKIEFTKNDGVMNVTLDGRLDTTTAPQLDEMLTSNLMCVNTLTIDCKKLVYISSAGLRVLLATHKKMKGAMKLVNVQELVMEVFEITGFSDILVIE